jgi:hypothetical protein
MASVAETAVFLPARRWTRHKVNVPIRAIVQKQSKAMVISGRGKEISDGGMAIFAGVELSLGEKIAVEFTPAYGLPIRVHGLVRTRNAYSYGIEFLAHNSEEEAEVTHLREILKGSVGFTN